MVGSAEFTWPTAMFIHLYFIWLLGVTKAV